MDRLDKALECAKGRFWDEIVEHYPEAESGDLCPLMCHQLDVILETAVKQWVENNVPT